MPAIFQKEGLPEDLIETFVPLTFEDVRRLSAMAFPPGV